MARKKVVKPATALTPLTDEGQTDAPSDMGERVTFTLTIECTREDFREGGPPRLMDKIRDASIAARDAMGAEVRKRRWTYDY